MAGDGGVQGAVVDAVGVNIVAHDLFAVVHAVGVSLGRAWRVEAGIDSVDVRKSMNAIRVEVPAHDFAFVVDSLRDGGRAAGDVDRVEEAAAVKGISLAPEINQNLVAVVYPESPCVPSWSVDRGDSSSSINEAIIRPKAGRRVHACDIAAIICPEPSSAIAPGMERAEELRGCREPPPGCSSARRFVRCY